MSLPTTYTQAYAGLKDFFNKIRDAQAPDKFSQQILKDLGFKSSNHRPYIAILKSLGFLSAEGVPTSRYKEYRNHAKSKQVMGEAIKEAYSDIFLIKSYPKKSDKADIEGKFKSFHNASDNVAKLHANTFYALLDLAELNFDDGSGDVIPVKDTLVSEGLKEGVKDKIITKEDIGLHYNIHIHLPATKDLEVYNAIFKSLKEHLID